MIKEYDKDKDDIIILEDFESFFAKRISTSLYLKTNLHNLGYRRNLSKFG